MSEPTNGVTQSLTSDDSLLPCDYLSFGCPVSFPASDTDALDAHLAQPAAIQKHLLLVQSAFVTLHQQYEGEKEKILEERAELKREQIQHAEDVKKGKEEVAKIQLTLQATRVTANELSEALHQEELKTTELKAQLEMRAVKIQELTHELREMKSVQVNLQSQIAKNAHATPEGLLLIQQRELHDSNQSLKHEVTSLRQQLHVTQMQQPTHSNEEWDELVQRNQEVNQQNHELLQQLHSINDTKDTSQRESQAKIVTLQHELATLQSQLQLALQQQPSNSTDVDFLKSLPKEEREQLLTRESDKYLLKEIEKMDLERAEFMAYRESVEKERSSWAIQKRNLELKLLRMGETTPPPNGPSITSPESPHLSRQSSISNNQYQYPPDPSTPSQQQLLPHPRPPTLVSIQQLAEKKKILFEKITNLETVKQVISSKLDYYLGSEIVYFEVTIEKGNLTAPPTPATPKSPSSLPPITNTQTGNSWTHSTEAAAALTAPSFDPSANSGSNKSALFIGLSLKDDSICIGNAPSHPSMQRPSVSASSLPGLHAGSFSYCSLNGHVYDGRPARTANTPSTVVSGGELSYGPSYGRGDTIGVGWNISTRQLFFTKNGIHLGIAGYEIDLAPYSACVGIVSSRGGEGFTINFGERPFLWRGLPLRDSKLHLNTQHFLYQTPPCAGMSLDASAITTTNIQLLPYQKPSSGGMDVTDLHDEQFEEDEYSTGMEGALSPSLRKPLLLSACFVVPTRDSGNEVRPFHSPTPPTSPTLTRSPSSSSPSESIGIVYSRQTLLPLLELQITVYGLLPLIKQEYPKIGWLSLHGYIKDSALANFKSVAKTERIAINDPRLLSATGELTLDLNTVHQSQPSRYLMVVLHGVDSTTGQQVMLGVSDDITDLSSFVQSTQTSVQTAISKDGRAFKQATISIQLHRVTGGKPTRRSQRLPRTSVSYSSGTYSSPSSTPAVSRPQTVSQLEPRSPHVFEYNVDSIYQHSPSSSNHASRSPTPYGTYPMEPSSPAAATYQREGVSGVATPQHLQRTISGETDPNSGLIHGSPPSHSPFRPQPPSGRTSGSPTPRSLATRPSLSMSSGPLDPDEAELAPLTKKLNTMYSEYRKLLTRLAQVREEVAAYLEEEEWTLFILPPSANSNALVPSSPQTLAQVAQMKKNIAAGLPVDQQTAGKPLRKSLIGVGPAAENDLDSFVQAGGGAYQALFHVHVLAQTLPTTQRFAGLKQLIPFVQKQHARLCLSYVERLRKQEEDIDSSCLFQ